MRLIQQIQLPDGRSTTNLGLGCAGILRIPTMRGREKLLRTAVDEGLTHFDVARMYGLGQAEGILGKILMPVRDQVTVGTKFGLPYVNMAGGSTRIQSIGRWLFNMSPGLKRMIRKATARRAPSTPQAFTPNHYSVDEMEKSLDLSLQNLQRNRVDLFYLHEPGMHDVIDENLGQVLAQKQASGKIGVFGLSGHRREVEHYLKTRPDVCGSAIQYSYSPLKKGEEGQPLQFPFTGMFSVIEGSLQPLLHLLSERKQFTRTWSEKLGLELGRRENVGIVILAMALALNPGGLVLFFTSNPKRLQQTIRRMADNQFSQENLLAFREAVTGGIHAN